jgi:pyrroline-5-carboxylate reductase
MNEFNKRRCGFVCKAKPQVAIQTVYGSTKMLLDTKKHPGEYKWITSPGGE